MFLLSFYTLESNFLAPINSIILLYYLNDFKPSAFIILIPLIIISNSLSLHHQHSFTLNIYNLITLAKQTNNRQMSLPLHLHKLPSHKHPIQPQPPLLILPTDRTILTLHTHIPQLLKNLHQLFLRKVISIRSIPF